MPRGCVDLLLLLLSAFWPHSCGRRRVLTPGAASPARIVEACLRLCFQEPRLPFCAAKSLTGFLVTSGCIQDQLDAHFFHLLTSQMNRRPLLSRLFKSRQEAQQLLQATRLQAKESRVTDTQASQAQHARRRKKGTKMRSQATVKTSQARQPSRCCCHPRQASPRHQTRPLLRPNLQRRWGHQELPVSLGLKV